MTSTGVEGRPRERVLGWRRARSSRTRSNELVVVEQAVELLELGLEAEAELGDQREQIGPVVSVSEHGSGVPSVRLVRLLSLPPAYKLRENKAISHRKLELHLLLAGADAPHPVPGWTLAGADSGDGCGTDRSRLVTRGVVKFRLM